MANKFTFEEKVPGLTDDMKNAVCQECGAELSVINPSHLRGSKCTGLEYSEYRKKYPGVEVMTPEARSRKGFDLYEFRAMRRAAIRKRQREIDAKYSEAND